MNSTTKRDPFLPNTAAEALAQWDDPKGLAIRTFELGGIGPAYEQCIWVSVFEILRDELGKPLPKVGAPLDDWANATLNRIDPHLRLSGAQWGVARHFAAQVLTRGWAAHVNGGLTIEPERMIGVSKSWPHIPVEAPHA